MAVSLELHPVEPRRLHPLGGVGVVADQALDVPVFHLLGKLPVRRLAFVGG
jgi:hypothetical protein